MWHNLCSTVTSSPKQEPLGKAEQVILNGQLSTGMVWAANAHLLMCILRTVWRQVFVAGASGGSGRQAVIQALEKGLQVRAGVRVRRLRPVGQSCLFSEAFKGFAAQAAQRHLTCFKRSSLSLSDTPPTNNPEKMTRLTIHGEKALFVSYLCQVTRPREGINAA